MHAEDAGNQGQGKHYGRNDGKCLDDRIGLLRGEGVVRVVMSLSHCPVVIKFISDLLAVPSEVTEMNLRLLLQGRAAVLFQKLEDFRIESMRVQMLFVYALVPFRVTHCT